MADGITFRIFADDKQLFGQTFMNCIEESGVKRKKIPVSGVVVTFGNQPQIKWLTAGFGLYKISHLPGAIKLKIRRGQKRRSAERKYYQEKNHDQPQNFRQGFLEKKRQGKPKKEK